MQSGCFSSQERPFGLCLSVRKRRDAADLRQHIGPAADLPANDMPNRSAVDPTDPEADDPARWNHKLPAGAGAEPRYASG